MKSYGSPNVAKDYDEAKRGVTAKIVMRQTRGNVKVQNGATSSTEKLLASSRRADELMKRTKALVEASR